MGRENCRIWGDRDQPRGPGSWGINLQRNFPQATKKKKQKKRKKKIKIKNGKKLTITK